MISLVCTNLGSATFAIKSLGDKPAAIIAAGANFFANWAVVEIKSNLWPGHGVDTGTLKGGYHAMVAVSKDKGLVVVSTEVEYAPDVEYGHGGRIAHFRPGIQSALAQTEAYLNSLTK